MQDMRLRFSKYRAFGYAAATVIFFNIMVVIIGLNLNDTWRQQEIIETTDRFIVFQNQVINLMETGSDLLRGYEAYIQVNGVLSDEETKAFLSFLTADEMYYIRNIGIIKDTTIIYNHPIEENQGSIGVDLAKVEGQSEVILNTKNTLKKSFQGPVNLVQGGRGYIMRQPLLDGENKYWGQVSIVLRADVIEAVISDFASANDLTVSIFEDRRNEQLIVGDEGLLAKQPLSFDLSTDLNEWVIYLTPIEGWDNYRNNNQLIIIASLLISLVIGSAVYYFNKVNFSLQRSLAKDHLTGLYNRHYLEHVQKRLFHEARGEDNRFGMLHIDLDFFKSINDIYGHEAGDKVLVETADILKRLTRSNELVFRVGGDEFLILIPWIRNKRALVDFKNRLVEDFEEEYKLGQVFDVNIGPSVGAGAYPEDGETFDEVLRVADQDMYEEKGKKKRR